MTIHTRHAAVSLANIYTHPKACCCQPGQANCIQASNSLVWAKIQCMQLLHKNFIKTYGSLHGCCFFSIDPNIIFEASLSCSHMLLSSDDAGQKTNVRKMFQNGRFLMALSSLMYAPVSLGDVRSTYKCAYIFHGFCVKCNLDHWKTIHCR